MVATMKATRGIIVTVCNYDEYQSPVNYESNAEGTTEETRKKSEGHTINKKVEERKNEKKEPKTLVVKHDVEEVITFLNTTTGSKYKSSTKATVGKIEARIKDGFSVDDIKTVITVKSKEWKGTDMAKYLRPSTLFAPDKFEDYLNQLEKNNSQQTTEGGLMNCECR